jgi:hypothetical protein
MPCLILDGLLRRDAGEFMAFAKWLGIASMTRDGINGVGMRMLVHVRGCYFRVI